MKNYSYALHAIICLVLSATSLYIEQFPASIIFGVYGIILGIIFLKNKSKR